MNENINYNEVLISGIINNVYDKNNKYIIFGLICDDYSKDNSKNYISFRVYEALYYTYKDLFIIGNKVFIKGYLKSYADKNRNIFSYVMVTKISNNPSDLINHRIAPHIRYDDDGIMVWNGKRCSKEPLTNEEQQELEKIINRYK